MAILRRISDGKGDQGSRIEAIKWHKDGTLEHIGTKPMIGYSLLVGSVTARSYSDKDYWLTTPITEILEEKQHGGLYMKFKTGNSIYEVWY
jgi:hypothetical protein